MVQRMVDSSVAQMVDEKDVMKVEMRVGLMVVLMADVMDDLSVVLKVVTTVERKDSSKAEKSGFDWVETLEHAMVDGTVDMLDFYVVEWKVASWVSVWAVNMVDEWDDYLAERLEPYSVV